jgi:hypothetical protein
LASGLVKILAVYLSPFQPVIDLDLSACFGVSDPILVAEDLISEH